MSVHAILNPEAQAKLQRQRRNATLTSVIVSLLSLTLLALILAFILLPAIVRENPTIVSYQGSNAVADTPEKTRLSTAVRPSAKPSASAASAKAIIAQTASPVSVPIPEIAFEGETFGNSGDFGDGGDGFGDGTGSGSGNGGGGGFGTANPTAGFLEGRLYDFKQKPDGSKLDYDLTNPNEYIDRVVRLQRSRFSESSLKRHFQAPQTLYLSHIAISYTTADAGPSYFQAADVIQPSGWLAHYKGKVRVPKTGTYRFSGLGDDYLVVFVNGRERLNGSWWDIHEQVAQRWKPTEPTGKHLIPMFGNRAVIYGDWIKLNQGDLVELNIAIGERPGGMVGFFLQIEEKSTPYRTTADGRPILPLFTTAPISSEEQDRITKAFVSHEFDWEQPLIFPAQ